MAVVVVGLVVLAGFHLADFARHLHLGIREKTQQLVEVAVSVLEYYHQQEEHGILSREDAQKRAIDIIKHLRYKEKEYFWIHDRNTRMVMHPYKPELDGTDISGYADPEGVHLFVEMEKAVRESGSGFVEYQWPKPGAEAPVPKVSYVQAFYPWGWTVGSGVYVDEVRTHIIDAMWDDVAVMTVVFALVSYVTWWLGRDITRTTRNVTHVMQRLASGNLDVVVPDTARTDELGQMAEAIDTFRRQEIQLREMNEKVDKAKSEFLSNISHELRTPMHAIMNYASMGVKKLSVEPDDKLNKYFKNIHTAGERLLRIINDLLDLSKMESGKMTYDMALQNFSDVLQYVQSELDTLLKDKDLDLVVQGEHDRWMAEFDKVRMTQVVINVLANAIRFTPSGSQISISMKNTTVDDVAMLECAIADQGAGIPDGELESVFDKFVQSSKTNTHAGGTGLGLSICKQIIDAHHGKIWAEHGKEQGAVFKFSWPVEQPKV